MTEPRTKIRFQLSGWLAVSAALAYLCRNSISVAEKTIRVDLGLSEETMGFIIGPAFFWTYALAQIPGGWSGQRFGSRRMLPILAVAFSAATALMGLALGAVTLLIGRVIGGIAQAGLFPCSALSISRWFPKTERAFASGILGGAMSVGAAVGAALTGELLGSLYWSIIFLAYSVPGIFWAHFFYQWFRETPHEHPQVNDEEADWIAAGLAASVDESTEDAQGDSAPAVPWGRLFRSQAVWLICGQQFFRAAGAAFFASWFATYLQETRGVTTAKSGWLLTLPLIATVLASICGGAVSDRIYARTQNLTLARSGLAAGALAVCAALVFSAFFVQNATMATLVIASGAFFGGIAGPCAYASTMDISGRHVAPVFSTMNMVGNFGAGLLPLVSPMFRKWVEQTPWALKLAGGNSWNSILILFGAMFFLASVCWAALRVKENSIE